MPIILIVEDNPANLKLARVVLEKAGYAVLEAMDAEAGLALARAQRPDLILIDIQLPGMDGLTATQELKRDPATAPIPVLALTAYAMKGDEEKILAAGCDGYLAKPFRYRELLERVAGLLPPSLRPIEEEGANPPLSPRGRGRKA